MSTSAHTFFYHKSSAVTAIQKTVTCFFKSLGIDLNAHPSREHNIRALMFECFGTDEFITNYLHLATTVAEAVGITEEKLLIQGTPTPRTLSPEQHGTSFHCDYWYGHGERFHTVWTPVSNIYPGNSFKLIADPAVNSTKYRELQTSQADLQSLAQLTGDCIDVLPGAAECAVFGSKVLHGSTCNSTPQERISFDFRIGPSDDSTSTKELDSYYQHEHGKFTAKALPRKSKYLKYICGGRGISTTVQHILIEGVCSNVGIEIAAQEAEIERFGFPMLLHHAVKTPENPTNFDGIVVASQSILTDAVTETLRQSHATIFFALENRWLCGRPQ